VSDVPMLTWSNRLITLPIVYNASLLGCYRYCGRYGNSMFIKPT